jgi:hypothetical protein
MISEQSKFQLKIEGENDSNKTMVLGSGGGRSPEDTSREIFSYRRLPGFVFPAASFDISDEWTEPLAEAGSPCRRGFPCMIATSAPPSDEGNVFPF